jgi:hypothetical protein
MAVVGGPEDVKAAIRRRASGAGPPAALAQKLSQYEGNYDLWAVAVGPFPALPAKPQTGAVRMDFLEHVDAFQGGVRFSPDLEISGEIVMRTEKEAAGMAESVRWLRGVIDAQNSAGLEKLKVEMHGRRMLFSLRAPEEAVRQALLNRRKQAAPAVGAPASGAPPASVSNAPRPASISAPPPPKTIRVTSSPKDMGTVLIPSGQ